MLFDFEMSAYVRSTSPGCALSVAKRHERSELVPVVKCPWGKTPGHPLAGHRHLDDLGLDPERLAELADELAEEDGIRAAARAHWNHFSGDTFNIIVYMLDYQHI